MTVFGTTRVLAVFGDPIAHSLSPAMHNPALSQAGIDAIYVPYHIRKDQIGEAVAAVRSLGIWGVNLTVPLKEVVCPHLDELDDDARLIGAVNTIVSKEGTLTGFNTDVHGFLDSLKVDLKFAPAGKRVLLLGAGGACRAAVVALGRAGARWVGIANRTFSRAESLVAEFSRVFAETEFAPSSLAPEDLCRALQGVDLLANTSAVGLKGETFNAFPWSDVPDKIPVFDMVYSVKGTSFVSEARAFGHPATGGLGMLAGQGEQSFQLWTGVAPPEGLMRACLMAQAQSP